METFVPLYIANECDSYCAMCGFNHSNSNLIRKVATIDEIREQLDIIKNYEKVSAICILTGELFSFSSRMENLKLVCEAINEAIIKPKRNAISILEDELSHKHKKGIIDTGAISDPYNPLEVDLKLTRIFLALADKYDFGVSIATIIKKRTTCTGFF